MVELIKTEKATNLWMGLLILVLSVIYVLVSLGKSEWIIWIAIVWGLFLVGFLIIEGGIITYITRKEYKKISFSDIVVWITFGTAFLLALNTTLLIGIVRENAPEWLLSFATFTGVTVGIIASLLAISYMIIGRPKN